MNAGIIGGGPAGATLAALLSAGGMRPVMFDDSHPREKPCAGTLDDRILSSWAVLRKYEEIRRFEGERIYTTPAGRTFSLPCQGPEHALVFVARSGFDAYLAAHAENQGARWVRARVAGIERRGRKWRVVTKGAGEYEFDFLAGADGAHSLVRKHTIGPFEKEDFVTGVGYRFKGLEIGYLHTAVTPDIGTGFVLPGYRQTQVMIAGRYGQRVDRAMLDEFLRRHFPGHENGEYFAASQPLPRSPAFFDGPRGGEDFVLLGDAGGFSNATNADGLRYAMASAHAAAAAILDGRPREFEARWRDTFGRELVEAAHRARLNPPGQILEAAAWAFGRSASLAALAHAAAHGKLGGRHNIAAVIRRAARVPLELAGAGRPRQAKSAVKAD